MPLRRCSRLLTLRFLTSSVRKCSGTNPHIAAASLQHLVTPPHQHDFISSHRTIVLASHHTSISQHGTATSPHHRKSTPQHFLTSLRCSSHFGFSLWSKHGPQETATAATHMHL
eukprot:10443901-Alexandrium_andersonii.AAC.1